jgi:hypothetical protein
MRPGDEAVLYKRAAARNAKEAAVYQSWMHRYFFPPRCLTCTDVTAQLADVSFGDPWLKRFMKSDCGGGLSLMVCRSAIGLRLLEMAIQDGAIVVRAETTAQEVADSQGKIPVKTNTAPYRAAAKLLGIKTPQYHGLFSDTKAGPLSVVRALWEYARLRLGRISTLWPGLLLLERVLQALREMRDRWKRRFNAVMRRVRSRLIR